MNKQKKKVMFGETEKLPGVTFIDFLGEKRKEGLI